MAEKVEFEPNTPIQLALKYQGDGKPVQGRFGDQKYFTLIGDRCMYLDLEVATQLEAYRFRAGEPFWIEKKWSGKKTEKPRWEIYPVDESGQETPLEADLRRSIERGAASSGRPTAPATTAAPARQQPAQQPDGHGISNGNGRANGNGNGYHAEPTPAPVTALEDALKTVALALFKAEIYAKEIGYEAWPKQFTPEDVRTMANTLVIQRRQP